MFEKEFVIEEGVVYHRQKPLHKQALFWTTIAGAVISVFLGIVVLFLLFFIGASELSNTDYSNEYYEDLSTFTDYGIGETVEFDDGLKVTVQSMKEDTAVELVDTYYSNALVVDLVLENPLEEDYYVDEYAFSLRDGYSEDYLNLDYRTYDVNIPEKLAPGEKVHLKLIYGFDEENELIFTYDDASWTLLLSQSL
jgi:hypothetical protein